MAASAALAAALETHRERRDVMMAVLQALVLSGGREQLLRSAEERERPR